MKYLVALVALAVVVFVGANSQPVQRYFDDRAMLERQAAEQAQLERERTRPLDDTFGLLWRVLFFVGAAGTLYIGFDFYRKRSQPLVEADRGLIPRDAVVSMDLVTALEVSQLRQQTAALVEMMRAVHQPGQTPAHLSYSYAPRIAASPAQHSLEAAEQTALAAAVPTFAQLLDSGRIGKGNPLLLGYDTEAGGELVGSWLDLYSTAVGGMPGSGKTTSQRFLAAQTALHGAKFAICDPHAGAAEDSLGATLAPLSAAFVCEIASSDKAILEVVRYVADVGKRRISGKDSDTTPLILWVDELTSLLGRSSVAGPLAELLEAIAQEYRKRHVFVCASGQIWTAERTTSELRDSFASVLCHRMKRSQARLLLPTDEAAQVERLEIGCAVLWRTSGATSTIAVPLTTAQDVQRVAGLLTDDAATMRLPRRPISSQNVAYDMPLDMPASSQTGSQGVATDVLAYSAPASAEAARAAQMFLDGMDMAQIVAELRGVSSAQGKRYQVALTEVQALVRTGMRGN